MILWLDHLIFGDGNGMKSPIFDSAFYWLGDQLYTFSPGLGAQLDSYQWTHPLAGEKRCLAKRDFVVLHSRRSWCRVRVAWSMVGYSGKSLDAAHIAIRELKMELDQL